MWQARAGRVAHETDRIAAEVAGLESRLRVVSAAVTALIGDATGREDRTMNQHLDVARGRGQETALTLRQAAATARRLADEP